MATFFTLSGKSSLKKTKLIANGTQINESNSAPLLEALQIFKIFNVNHILSEKVYCYGFQIEPTLLSLIVSRHLKSEYPFLNYF